MIDIFSIDRDPKSIAHVVILPYILNDENVVKIHYGENKLHPRKNASRAPHSQANPRLDGSQ